MAESLTALGVASKIVQFVEIGLKVSKAVIETHQSVDPDDLADRNADLCLMTTSLENKCTVLQNDTGSKADAITMRLLSRCIDVAKELLSELDHIKLNNEKRQSRQVIFPAFLKAYWEKSNIHGIQEKLVQIKNETFERLETLLHEYHLSLSEAIRSLKDESSNWNSATEERLNVMARELANLLRSENDEKLNEFSDDLASFAKRLSEFVDEAGKKQTTWTILKSLLFIQTKERQSGIAKAHKGTFEWIFGESSAVSFPSWLREPSNSVFWVTGKPGSGKSTLMKLISDHEKTRSLAEAWAGSKPLIIASHFFWSAGTRLQKSQEGLLRTLLFQILVHCPELVPEICAKRYTNPSKLLEPWSVEELLQAFVKLQSLSELPSRVLLLIDGLDEYSGGAKDVTKFLHSVGNSSDIKVCCASRPWPHFLKAFKNTPWQVEMHKMTKADMQSYIEDCFSKNERFQQLRTQEQILSDEIIQEISEKADGVFFWVSLVVKGLVRGIDSGDDLKILQKRLLELPSDLDQLFQRMLDSIEEIHREEASFVFTLLLTAKSSLPVQFFRSLTELQILASNMKWGTPYYGGTCIPENSLDKENRILARCRDLVQSWEGALDLPRHNDIRLGFLHRTVVEFLQETPMLQRFVDQLPVSPCLLLAAAYYLEAQPCGNASRTIDEDYIFRMCYLVQEIESDAEEKYDELLWRLLLVLRFILEAKATIVTARGFTSIFQGPHPNALRVVAYAQARVLLRLNQIPPDSQLTASHLIITPGLLYGTPFIEAGDRFIVHWSDSIDLGLLNSLLDFYNANLTTSRKHMNIVWRVLMQLIADTRSHTAFTRQLLQACKVFVERGAPRFISPPPHGSPVDLPESLLSKVDQYGRLDVIDMLQSSNIFRATDLEDLEALFPSQTALQNMLSMFDPVWRIFPNLGGESIAR
ncbi:uncharacterized protein CTRU02_202647 [Colletotrichum truncatum]|uniref:Uncharacterized protein n=1 Tax=Colletotrichum truncatum TaxID=5467 RepID=A0ACC3ZKZ5_COLTU|nr:uncharacterized protein CTRU02_10570 [Colletotrichum truncatum]KAF6786872.1 hypothetical protein CTRU02_10570 [Colletotrichum truncatum]